MAYGRLQGAARASLLRRSLEIHPRADLVVIGELSYGGYRIPDGMLTADSVVYTVGAGEDIRFDLELIQRYGCTVHAMDPVPRSAEYVRGVAADEPRLVFHQLALWSRDEALTFHAPRTEGYVSHSAVNRFGTEPAFQAEGRSLRSLMRSLGHDHLDLLKVSAEGAEFEILGTLLRGGPVVPILCAELVLPPLARARGLMTSLANAGYELVSAYVTHDYWTFTWVNSSRSDPL
jgi:FkbM family methyltransferase